jgi:hypothetical protein
MPAKLVISSGSAVPATEVWIERPFVKVGAGAGNDVRVQPAVSGAALPDVAVYVQFRNGRYEVFNKDCEEIAIGTQPIARGQTFAWSPHERLRLGAGVEIELVVEGDPSPTPRAAARRGQRSPEREPGAVQSRPVGDGSAAGLPKQERARGLNGRQVAQLGVTGACLLACLLMAIAKRDSGTADLGSGTFAQLVVDGLAGSGADVDIRRRLTSRLQAAEAAYLVGDRSTALSRYEQIKRRLDPHRDGLPKGDEAVAAAVDESFIQRLAAFVDSRVAALAPMP